MLKINKNIVQFYEINERKFRMETYKVETTAWIYSLKEIVGA